MDIQLISDLHGRLPEIPPCDVLVIAGDICPDFHDMSRARLRDKANQGVAADVGEQRQCHWLDTEFRAWLSNVPAKVRIGIAGNHDFVFERRFLIPKELPWTYLQDEAFTYDGVKFYGLPWVPNLQRWAFYGDDRKLDLAYQSVPDDTDVVISHGPPLGYRDAVSDYFMRPGMVDNHVGAPQAVEMIDRVRPKMYVCGHIHEGFGSAVKWHPGLGTGGTVVYNVAHVDEAYGPRTRNPIKVTLP